MSCLINTAYLENDIGDLISAGDNHYLKEEFED
jgi:hypothetical protein